MINTRLAPSLILYPLPTFRLQTRWCKGRGVGASIHWMELVPQLGLQLCGWCMRGAVACSARSHKRKRSGQSDSLGLLVMSLFGVAGWWIEPRWFLFCIQGRVRRENIQPPSSFVAHVVSFVLKLSMDIPCHSLYSHLAVQFLEPPLLFLSQYTAFYCHPPFFHPKGFSDILPRTAFRGKWPLSG